MQNNNGPRSRFRFSFFYPLAVVVIVLALGGVVMFLWNAVLVPATGVRALGYGQAIGLLVLCRILFGRFIPGSSVGRHRGGPWRDKWMHMSPEERERFQEEWKKRCGPGKGDNKQ